MRLRHGMIFAAITVAIAALAQQGDNLLANPGFGDGLAGWEVVNPVGDAA